MIRAHTKMIDISGCVLTVTVSHLIIVKQPNKTLLIKRIAVVINTAILTAVSIFINNNVLASIILKFLFNVIK